MRLKLTDLFVLTSYPSSSISVIIIYIITENNNQEIIVLFKSYNKQELFRSLPASPLSGN